MKIGELLHYISVNLIFICLERLGQYEPSHINVRSFVTYELKIIYKQNLIRKTFIVKTKKNPQGHRMVYSSKNLLTQYSKSNLT